MKQFKYTTKFTATARCLVDGEKDGFLVKASLDDLKQLIPQEVVGTADLVPIAGNLFTANIANLNGAVVLGKDAVNLYKMFLYRPLNANHLQSEPIGTIIKTALSKFNINYLLGTGSELLEEEEVRKNIDEPFNCAIAGVLFRLVDEDKVSEIEDSANPDSKNYLYYSLSFEVGFEEYSVLLGSNDARKGELITDKAKCEELQPMLKQFGGKGVDKDGNKIYCVLAGDMMAAGAGIVRKPAGTVLGLVSASKDDKEVTCASCNKSFDYNKEPEASAGAVKCPHCNKTINQEGKVLESLSQIDKKSVNRLEAQSDITILEPKRIKMKKLKSLAEIKELTQEDMKDVCLASLVHVADASLREDVEAGLEKASKEYSAKIKAEADAKTEALNKAKAAEDKVVELEKIVADEKKAREELANKVQVAEAAEAQRVKDEAFQRHMAYLSENYELDETKSAALAKQIKDLDDDGFKGWLETFEAFAAKKVKKDEKEMTPEEKKAMKDKMKEKFAKASQEDIEAAVEKALADAEKEKQTIANARENGKPDNKSWTLGEGIELTK